MFLGKLLLLVVGVLPIQEWTDCIISLSCAEVKQPWLVITFHQNCQELTSPTIPSFLPSPLPSACLLTSSAIAVFLMLSPPHHCFLQIHKNGKWQNSVVKIDHFLGRLIETELLFYRNCNNHVYHKTFLSIKHLGRNLKQRTNGKYHLELQIYSALYSLMKSIKSSGDLTRSSAPVWFLHSCNLTSLCDSDFIWGRLYTCCLRTHLCVILV